MNENTANVVIGTMVVALIGGLILGLMYGIPSYNRFQKRADANNEVLVNEIRIKQQEQLILVEQQKAQIRIQEAKGISESQKIINATLTDQYLQHEAIQAQEKMAGSPNHTQIYIPVGNNGIPLVKTVDSPN
jgi:hypothetical protein